LHRHFEIGLIPTGKVNIRFFACHFDAEQGIFGELFADVR